MPAKLHLNFGGFSDAGIKASNEDAFSARLPTEHSVRKYKGAVACIADGVSCSENAQIASQTAVTGFVTDYFNTPDFWTVKQSASKVIGSINSWLYQQGQQNHARTDGYVATFSALIIKSHTAHILHAGDSRIYLIRDGQCTTLTRDHNYKRAGESILSRALGIEKQLDLDYRSLKVKVGDRFLLTTDGVHDTLDEKTLLALLDDIDHDIEGGARHIAQQALQAGSEDNISCLIVHVESLPIERIEEIYKDLTALTIPPVMQAGNRLDHFEIIRELHSGTRSHVYLARDTINDELRVLKAPSINFAEDLNYLEGFAREQWIGRKVSHPQIMKIYAPPEGTQFLYHICEYIEGATLRQWMIDNPRASLDQVRTLLESMIVPVRVLHRNEMVHRDLKPENFIVNRDGIIKLIDFGTVKVAGVEEIASQSLSDIPVGDIGYIAPEYLVHGVVNNQSDLFSLATICYEMLCGELPFKAVRSNRDFPKSFDRWNYHALNKRSSLADDLPHWVDWVLRKALSPNPVYRYAAMSEFQQDLRTPSSEILKSIEFKPLMERNPLLFWKTLSLVLLGVVIAQWLWFVSLS